MSTTQAFTWDGLVMPDHLLSSLQRYAEQHVETGRFLRSILENDSTEAVCRADHFSFPLLPVIVRYVYNELPAPCWGSKERVSDWLKKPAEVAA